MPEGAKQEDYVPFLQAMRALGFVKKAVDCSNSHFVTFELQRQAKPAGSAARVNWPRLGTCSYKRR